MMKIFFIFLLSGVAFVASAQVAKKPAPKAAKKTTASKVASAKGAGAISPAVKASMERGKTVYTTTCLPCHQADGLGVPNMNPPLSKTEYVLGEKLRLVNILLKGLNTDVVVNGDTYTNPMPPVNYLTDDQVADVLTYVRNSFGNKASAVTKAEVTKARK